MARYIIRRLIQAVPTLLGITILSYALMSAAPGGPVAAMTFSPKTTPAQKAVLTKQLGLDDPVPVQYIKWLGRILQGDMGRSFQGNRKVLDLIVERSAATLELGGLSLLFGVLIGVPV